jgi:large subunit ribosomal protein L29
MDMKELQTLTPGELTEKAMGLKHELFNLRFQLATGRIENQMRIRQTRRDLARVKTAIRQNELRSGTDSKKGGTSTS